MKGEKELNTIVTSKEEILSVCRELVREEGWKSIHMRSVAKHCNISIGSIYNYFESKTDLVAETVASIWCDIFHFPESQQMDGKEAPGNGGKFAQTEDELEFAGFAECIEWIFERLKQGEKKYPGFFSHHPVGLIGEEKKSGQKRMDQSWLHIKECLAMVLKSDQNVRADVFDEKFTGEEFVEIIFSLIISAMLRHNFDSAGILEMIRRVLY